MGNRVDWEKNTTGNGMPLEGDLISRSLLIELLENVAKEDPGKFRPQGSVVREIIELVTDCVESVCPAQ